MDFLPTLRFFHKNNARNIAYMAVLIFPKNLDLRKNAYSRTASQGRGGMVFQVLLRNPLAGSYILGISGGSVVCAICGILLGLVFSRT